MPIEIKIPRLGWSMNEGIFTGWLKKNGESVKSGEPLFTLEGEKAAQDIEATDTGTLHIPLDAPQPGDTVKVGQAIGFLFGKNDAIESVETPQPTPPVQNEKPPDHAPPLEATVPPASGNGQLRGQAKAITSSPRARRRARELGVEVNQLSGTGRTGRIIEADVVKAATSRSETAKAAPTAKPVLAVAGQISTMRRNIAERTALSFSQIPHFYLRAEADVTELVVLREHLVSVLERECGVRITITDFLLRAQSRALQAFPAANAVWQNNGVLRHEDADVGVVVGLPDGLVIPVLRAAQKLSFVELARERARLVEAVHGGRFNAEMLSGGASSLSNLGTTRTDEFAAIIAPHQSSMLAVGRAVPRPYVVEGRLQIRTTLRLCLSVDHRVLDGGPAADFLGKIVAGLENPQALVDDD